MKKRKLGWWERLRGWVADDPNHVYELTLAVYPPQRDGGAVVLLPQLTDREVVAVEFLSARQHNGAPYRAQAAYFTTEGRMPNTFGFSVARGLVGFAIGYYKERSRLTLYEPAGTIEYYVLKFYYRNKEAS